MIVFDYLEIEGYRSFSETPQRITLGRPGIYLLRGENYDRGSSSGAGKSTIFKALCTTLFEKNDDGSIKKYGVNNILRRGYAITLELLDHKNERYKIVYSYQHPQHKSAWNIYNYTGHTWNILYDRNDAAHAISQLLHLTYDQFIHCAYMSQNINEFIQRANKERVDVLSKILNIEKIEQWRKVTRHHINQLKDEYIRANERCKMYHQQMSTFARDFIDQNIDELQQHYVQQLQSAQHKLSEENPYGEYILLQQQYAAYNTELNTVNMHIENLRHTEPQVFNPPDITPEIYYNQIQEKQKELIALTNENAVLQSHIQRFQSLDNVCPMCEQKISKRHKDTHINELQKKYAQNEQLTQTIKNTLDELQQKYHIAQKQMQEYTIAYEMKKQYTKQLLELIEKQKSIQHHIEQLTQRIDISQDYYHLYKTFEEQKHNTVAIINHAQEQIQKINQYIQVQKAYERECFALKTIEQNMEDFKTIEGFLGDGGFRSWKLAKSRVVFNNALNEALSILTDGTIEAELVFETAMADNKGTKNEVDILVRDGEKTLIPIRQYSGGEKALLSLAIIHAFWCLSLHQSHHTNVLLLDEPFANMDNVQITKACDLLKKIYTQGQTIIVSTNQPDVAELDIWSGEICVTKQHGISTVKENYFI